MHARWHQRRRGGARRIIVETLAACLLDVPRWKVRAWKAKYDEDRAAFGAGAAFVAGIENTVEHLTQLAKPEALRTFAYIQHTARHHGTSYTP